MPFVELVPPPKAVSLTGVRFSCGPHGVTLTIAGEAFEALGSPAAGETCKVAHDKDPGFPRLRVQMAKDGKFAVRQSTRGSVPYRLLKLGKALATGRVELKKLDCQWELSGDRAIDIELPRELVATSSNVHRATPSTSGGSKHTEVSLPATRSARA